MKKALLGFTAVLLTAAVVGVAATSTQAVEATGFVTRQTTPAYSCASVHFGMDDNTLTGTATLSGGTISVGEYDVSVGTVSGVTMTGYTVSNQAVYCLTDCGLKMSSSSKNSTITFTFTESIIGCDVYAVGWKGDASYITINDDAETKTRVTNDTNLTGNGSVDTTYYKYHFDFDSTNELTITASKRVIIGDIALRVA